MTEWIIDCFINFVKSEIWSTPVDAFIYRYQDRFLNFLSDMDEHLALHASYHELTEPLLNDFLCQMEVTYDEFLRGLNEGQNETKIKNYKDLLNRIISIYDFQIFREMMHDANNQIDIRPFLATNSKRSSIPDIEAEDQDFYLDQVLRLSKDAFELRECELNKRLEDDLNESMELSKDEYTLYMKGLMEEQKMLEDAIELSIKEIEKKEAEEMMLLKPFLKSTATLKELVARDEMADLLPPNDTRKDSIPCTMPSLPICDIPGATTLNISNDLPTKPTEIIENLPKSEPDPNNTFYSKELDDIRPTLEDLKLRKKYLLERYDKIREKLKNQPMERVAGDGQKVKILKEYNEKLREELFSANKDNDST